MAGTDRPATDSESRIETLARDVASRLGHPAASEELVRLIRLVVRDEFDRQVRSLQAMSRFPTE